MAASLSKTLNPLRPFLFYSRNRTTVIPFSAFSTAEPTICQTSPADTATSAAASSQSPEKESGRWSRLLLFLPGAITFGLGTWQILRRQEKVEMLEYRRKRLEEEPLLWNKMQTLNAESESLEFRKILCEGDFDEGKSVYIGPRSRSISGVTENGYYVITPLIPRTVDHGSLQIPILVNRGWVPRDLRNKSLGDSRVVEEPTIQKTKDVRPNEGSGWWKFWSKKTAVSSEDFQQNKNKEPARAPVKIIGVVRGSEKPSIFVPENDPNAGQWFYVDIPMIARACGIPENTLYIEDINEKASASNPYPVPKDVSTLIRFSVMPQDHLNYTITWYSLSAAVTFMAFRRISAKKIKR